MSTETSTDKGRFPRLDVQTEGKIRDLPIGFKLSKLLQSAARTTGIDRVVIYSGGQCAIGTCDKRVGSTRHDRGRAADVQLWRLGRVLSFENPADRPIIANFVTACARDGGKGFGAGVDYMGPHGLHIGFGKPAVWGRDGKAANAPEWLKNAVKTGWTLKQVVHLNTDKDAATVFASIELKDSDDPEIEPESERP